MNVLMVLVASPCPTLLRTPTYMHKSMRTAAWQARRGFAIVPIKMPKIYDGTGDGKVREVRKKAGDLLARDEVIMVVETEKLFVDVCAPADGLISKLLVDVHSIVVGGQDVAMVEDAAAPSAASASAVAAATTPAAPAAPAPASSAGKVALPQSIELGGVENYEPPSKKGASSEGGDKKTKSK